MAEWFFKKSDPGTAFLCLLSRFFNRDITPAVNLVGSVGARFEVIVLDQIGCNLDAEVNIGGSVAPGFRNLDQGEYRFGSLWACQAELVIVVDVAICSNGPVSAKIQTFFADKSRFLFIR